MDGSLELQSGAALAGAELVGRGRGRALRTESDEQSAVSLSYAKEHGSADAGSASNDAHREGAETALQADAQVHRRCV